MFSTCGSLCFQADRKTKIGLDIFYFSETAEQNSTKLKNKLDIDPCLYQVVVLTDRKPRWPLRSLIDGDIYDFPYETA